MTDKSEPAKGRSSQILCVSGMTLDVGKRQVTGCNGTKSVTPKECQLLTLFMSNSGRVLSRKYVMKKVWKTDYLGDTRTLEVHICWLRRKIEKDPHRPQHLVTVRGVGYRFGEAE